MNKKYGKWVYDHATETLSYPVNELHEYDIPLQDMTSATAMLDWIMQINSKVWGRGECTAELVAALNDIFRPQANLCRIQDGNRFNAASYLRNRRV